MSGGLLGGWNRYSYVDSDPLGFTDPLGLVKIGQRPIEEMLLGGGGGGGTIGGSSGGASGGSRGGGSTSGGSAGASAAGAAAGAGAAAAIDKLCRPDDPDDCKQVASDWELKNAGIDAHEVKKGLGSVRLFEICKCKSGGFAVKRKGCQGPIIYRL